MSISPFQNIASHHDEHIDMADSGYNFPAKQYTLSNKPTAAKHGIGTAIIIGSGYHIELSSDGVSWYSRGHSELLSDRPSAASFGKGEWNVGGLYTYLCDGGSWNLLKDNPATKVTYAVFDGVTSKVTLPKTYSLASDGDYIEFVAKVMEIQSVGGSVLGMLGVAGTNVDYIGPSSTSGNFAIRDHTGANQNLAITGVLTNYSGYDWHRYRITQTSSILWTITIDGTVIGTLARGNYINIDCIGQGYSTTYCTHAMKELTISTEVTGTLRITDFSTQLDEKKITYTSGVTFQTFDYIQGDVIALGQHVSIDWINVYVPQANSTNYIQYLYQNTIDLAKNADVYRIKSAYIATPVELPLIWGTTRILTTTTGEWENAVRITADDDFFGGSSHGKDAKQSNSMSIDGIAKTLPTFIAGSGALVEFNQTSACYKKVATDYAAVHCADSVRKWQFTADDLKIDNTLTWLTSEILSSCYLGMCPILRSDVTGNITEWGLWGANPAPVDISAAGFTIVNNVGVSTIAMFGDTTGIYVQVQATNDFSRPNALTWIANDATYNKIYVDYTGTAYTTTIGEVMTAKNVYKIKLTK